MGDNMAVNFYRIPLVSRPQRFRIALNRVEYEVTCRWNQSLEGGWFLDFIDAKTNQPIVMNCPLVTGIDILGQYEYLGFAGQLFIYTDGDGNAVPTLENLGSESNLYFITET
jgi:hypothetical protein